MVVGLAHESLPMEEAQQKLWERVAQEMTEIRPRYKETQEQTQ